jgi:hypothetical protein
MRFILATLLTAFFAIALGTFLPWWSIAISAFAVAIVLPLKPGISFFAGFLGIFLGWIAIAIVRDATNDGILSHKIASILPLGGSSLALILVSGFIGAVVGGFAALAGSMLLRLRTERDV